MAKKTAHDAASKQEKRGRPPKVFLGVTEICDIIRTCNENNVCNLHYHNLDISFLAGKLVDQHSGKFVESQENLVKHAEENLVEENLKLQEENLANLHIEDPARFEDMLANEELEENEETTNGNAD